MLFKILCTDILAFCIISITLNTLYQMNRVEFEDRLLVQILGIARAVYLLTAIVGIFIAIWTC